MPDRNNAQRPAGPWVWYDWVRGWVWFCLIVFLAQSD